MSEFKTLIRALQENSDDENTSTDINIGWKDALKLTLAAGAAVVGAAVVVAAEEVLSDATKSEQPKRKFNPGDMVCVLDDADVVQHLQKGHGGWDDAMLTSIGQTGKVLSVDSDGDVKIAVKGSEWTYNPLCLAPVDLAMMAQKLLLSIKSGAAVEVIKLLHTIPELVNVQVSDKSPLHLAVAENSLKMLNIILEFKPNMEIKDEDGDTPLHLTTYSKRENIEIVEALLNAGASVNAKNNKGATPLMIAVLKGYQQITQVFLKQPSIDLQQQDKDGDTVLHYAVLKEKFEFISLLLETGASPTARNNDGFTAMHTAAKIGSAFAVELLIELTPQYINNKKDDGYTMLHLAVLHNHIGIINVLAASECCNLDLKNAEEETALHLALIKQHLEIAEQLVGYGADINATDKDGDTPLHYAFVLKKMAAPSKDTPQLLKVRDKLQTQSKLPDDNEMSNKFIWACFLVQEGADTEIKNKNGNSALEYCPTEYSDAIMWFKQTKGSFLGCLRFNHSDIAHTPNSITKPAASEGKVMKAQKLFSSIESGVVVEVMEILRTNPELVNVQVSKKSALHCAMATNISMLHTILELKPDLEIKDKEGDTALHYAVRYKKNDCLSVLLEAGANLTGYCDLDLKNAKEETALHIALLQQHLEIAEQLVGYGADINAADKDGDTPLHYAFVLKKITAPSKDTPQLLKVMDKLQSQFNLVDDNDMSNRIILACFLVQEGADTEIKSKNGMSALEYCPTEYADIITQFKQKGGSFYGSLRLTASFTLMSNSKPVLSEVTCISPLDSEPSLPHLIDIIATEIPAKFILIGFQLGFKSAELPRLDDYHRAFGEMFDKWRIRGAPPYTWRTIIDALSCASVGEVQLSEYLTSQITM